MTEIEKYAVNLVGTGAVSFAEDGEFEDRNDWLGARDLGLAMAEAVQNNPEAFLAWYRAVSAQ